MKIRSLTLLATLSAASLHAAITTANAVWQVYLEPEQGWRPEWEHGVMAAVVLGCLLMSLLVGIIMASWAEQKRLLGDVLVSPGSLSSMLDLNSQQYSSMPDRSGMRPDMFQLVAAACGWS